MTVVSEAKQFLLATYSGVLSTYSARFKGYPFGSITPFVVDRNNNPLILISTLAEHTKNIHVNSHVSLIAFDPAVPDLQAAARLTLLGKAVAADKQSAELRERYLTHLPQAEPYFEMQDFMFYRITVEQARFINGFGQIHWIQGSALRQNP